MKTIVSSTTTKAVIATMLIRRRRMLNIPAIEIPAVYGPASEPYCFVSVAVAGPSEMRGNIEGYLVLVVDGGGKATVAIHVAITQPDRTVMVEQILHARG